jgi:hypothetical protein
VFPYGLPVAKVTKVERDQAQPLAQIHAEPLAHIDNDREVLFVWGNPNHPAAPAASEALAVEVPQPQTTATAAAKPVAAKPAVPKPATAKPVTPKPKPVESPTEAPPADAPTPDTAAPVEPAPEAPAT